MRDRDIAASLAAGEPDGLAAAYDHHAAGLYGYCRSLLGQPADAADAVQDTFIVATAKLAGLHSPARLRSWMYAIARNECHSRLRAGAWPAAGGDAVTNWPPRWPSTAKMSSATWSWTPSAG